MIDFGSKRGRQNLPDLFPHISLPWGTPDIPPMVEAMLKCAKAIVGILYTSSSGQGQYIGSLTYLPPRVVYREFPKEGIYREKIRQILSTPFRPKIDQNGLKTTLNGVGRASRGIGQLIAPSSSNMSPWGLMTDPFVPNFIKHRAFFDDNLLLSLQLFRRN